MRFIARSSRRKRERGQVSLMMGMMVATFLFFFAFVVNTGMLVHAKINLQNAADLAAYAGAAVQARQLTQISFLNYEMRRAYKRFLYRYYVLGGQSYDCFPRGGAALPSGCQTIWQMANQPPVTPNSFIDVPSVCISFKPNDDYCRVSRVPELAQVPNILNDPITRTLNSFYDKLNQAKTDMCLTAGTTNVQLLNLWLWNTDPELTYLANQLAQTPAQNDDDRRLRDSLTVLQTLGAGIGLIPREILLSLRIKTLEGYLNTAAQTVTRSDVDQLADPGHRSPEPQAAERTIQAFRSAFYTLGNGAFDADSVQLTEVLPTQLVKLNPIQQKFDAWATYLEPDPNKAGACDAKFMFDGPNAGPLTLGYWKDPNVLTYYAVKLEAKTKLLFSPFGEITLRAYAAAKPFGSRIGPRPGMPGVDWAYSGQPRGFSLPIGEGRKITGFIPNLPVRETDSAGQGKGWDTPDWLYSAYQMLVPPGNVFTPATQIDGHMIARALQAVTAPTKNEPLNYNIPYDGDDPMIRNFDTERVLAMWAPVMPASSAAGAGTQLDSELGALFGAGFNQGQGNPISGAQAALFNLVRGNMGNYISRLHAGKGEAVDMMAGSGAAGGEGFNVVRITDPTQQRPWDAPGSLAPLNPPGGFFALQSKDLRTSWSDVAHSYAQLGRIGYSVKFVTFQSLDQNGANRISSASAPGFDEDFPFLQH